MKKEYKEIFPAIRVGNSTNNLAGRIAFLSVAFFALLLLSFILFYYMKTK